MKNHLLIILFCIFSLHSFANDTLIIQYNDTVYSTVVNPFLKSKSKLPFYFYPVKENIEDSLIFILNDSLPNGTYKVIKDHKIKQLVSYQGNEKVGFEYYYWNNGNLKEKINWDLRNSPSHSTFFESYHENGNLKRFSTDTLHRLFYENGNKGLYLKIKDIIIEDTTTMTYSHLLHGEILHNFFLSNSDTIQEFTINKIKLDTLWHQNGQINSEEKTSSLTHYFFVKKYNYKTGLSIFYKRNVSRWYPTGIKACEMNSSHDTRFFNVSNSWDTLGNPMVVNGTGHHEEWDYSLIDSSYHKYWEMTYKNGGKHGKKVFYSMTIDGLKISSTEHFKNDLLHGIAYNYKTIMEDNQIIDFVKSEKIKYKHGAIKRSKSLIKKEITSPLIVSSSMMKR